MTKDEKHAQPLTHGGDWAGFEMEYGRAPLDFSMNVNPLGIAPDVQAAIAKAGQSADRYPDPLCRTLVQRLAELESVPPEWIFCGNGAADIIFRLAEALRTPEKRMTDPPENGVSGLVDNCDDRHFDHSGSQSVRRPVLLITAPTFSEYETAFAGQGWEVRRFLLEEEAGFHITGGFLQAIDRDVDAVFLCEPNNPTGVTTERQGLDKILQRCREAGAKLIIDECFNGFLEDPEAHSMKDALKEPEDGGLIILKAFTKLYGMAGVRLGYCLCGDPQIIGRIRAAGPPWNVSSLAQAAGIAALEAGEHVREGLRIVHEERPWLKEQLRQMGITRIYGEANYLLFRWVDPSRLDQRLREKGVLIRSCGNYPGLGEGWYRIAVRTHEENERLAEAMMEESRKKR